MERTGLKEGILFIDEINCVSETLAPTMLQFLQNKTFGTHAVPPGWVIVAAGNPQEYNKSVREFDIVTLDRVKRMEVEADLEVWKEYAYAHQIHPSIIAYLNLKKERFYHIENTASGKYFVTARGWEDLSEILYSYEELEVECGEALMLQYLQEPETARDFAGYYQLYHKYRAEDRIPEILDGSIPKRVLEEKIALIKAASYDERLTVAGLILNGWNGYFETFTAIERFLRRLHEDLRQIQGWLKEGIDLEICLERKKHAREVKAEAGLLSPSDERLEMQVQEKLESFHLAAKMQRKKSLEEVLDLLTEQFAQELDKRNAYVEKTQAALERGFSFAEEVFADGPELTLLVSDLTCNPSAMEFIRTFGCEKYFAHCDHVLLQSRQKKLMEKIDALLDKRGVI
jgi:type I site-specific restriction-modification system R (restriction) subunit